MIACFPDPYPDELFYSICARFQHRMKYPTQTTLNTELFGINLTATIDLPSHLNYFVTRLPPNQNLTTDDIIDAHTLLPFYSPFLPKERVSLIRNLMKENDASGIHSYAGASTPSVRSPNWFRFCPLCVNYDKKKYGECYWHRLHQIPGVVICPTHAVYLEDSMVQARNRQNRYSYVPAEQSIQLTTPRLAKLRDANQRKLMDVAINVEWTLNQPDLSLGLGALRDGYLRILIEKGFVSNKGKVQSKKLILAIREHFPSSLLQILQCDFNEHKPNNWPSLLFLHLKWNLSHHPMRHFVLLNLFNYTSETFLKMCDQNCDSNCEQVLMNLWENPSHHFIDIDTKLNVISETVKYRAAGVELKFAHLGPNQTLMQNKPVIKRDYGPSSMKIKGYRKEWLSIIKQNPQATRSSIRLKPFYRFYKWLRKHDSKWLNEHLPAPRKRGGNNRPIDWNSRDMSLAEKVRQYATKLKDSNGRPIRVTPTAISRGINQPPIFLSDNETYQRRLPLTFRALADVVENNLEFYLRKIQWAADCFRFENKIPTRAGIAYRASLDRDSLIIPEIESALDHAWSSLQRSITSNIQAVA